MRLSVARLRRVVKRDLTIQFVPQALTSYGGLELLGRYLHRVDLQHNGRSRAWPPQGGSRARNAVNRWPRAAQRHWPGPSTRRT